MQGANGTWHLAAHVYLFTWQLQQQKTGPFNPQRALPLPPQGACGGAGSRIAAGRARRG